MPRHSGSGGANHTRRQRGRSRRGHGIGTYSRLNKAADADSYLDKPPWVKGAQYIYQQEKKHEPA